MEFDVDDIDLQELKIFSKLFSLNLLKHALIYLRI